MAGIVRRREDRRNGVASGGGGVARRNNNNGGNRNRNRNRGGGGGRNSGGSGQANNPVDENTVLNNNANKDPLSGWNRHWAGLGVNGAGTDAFSNWFNNSYFNDAIAKYKTDTLHTTGANLLDWLGSQGYTRDRLMNDWRSQSPLTQQLTGSGQARWQFF